MARYDRDIGGQTVILRVRKARAMATKAQLNRMGQAILDFEARRDSRGRLAVYPLPAGDGGGRIEVAGINDRYHPVECAELVQMIRDRKYDEAERYARNFMIRYTDAVTTWMPIGMDPGIEFFCATRRARSGRTAPPIYPSMSFGSGYG